MRDLSDMEVLEVTEAMRAQVPDKVDWHEQGGLTPIKNQGKCGSCWSFSTIETVESAVFMSTGKAPPVLSEQQLVDCDKADQGCAGGSMENAFAFAESRDICTETSYGYSGKSGQTCQAASCAAGLAVGAVSGYKDVAPDDEAALMEAVSEGPVSVAIEADKLIFQLYVGGVILAGNCGNNLDHGVLVVGYGTATAGEKRDYWKVKNSWGSLWGKAGYVDLFRGKGGHGECGVLSAPTYPVMASAAVAV